MPAGGQHKQAAGAFRNLQERRVAIVEARQNPRTGEPIGFELPMPPEMYLGEITETRIGKGRKQRMLEINLAEHRVADGWGLRGPQTLHAGQPDGGCSGGGGAQNALMFSVFGSCIGIQ